MFGISFGGGAPVTAETQSGSAFGHDGKVVRPGRWPCLPEVTPGRI